MLLSVNIQEAGYSRQVPTLKNLRFSVSPGELVGLIGPNGAGKSTTVKSIMGIIHHFKGDIDVNEYAYIPERPIFYAQLTLWEHIDFLFSTLATTDETAFFQKAHELLDLFNLSAAAHSYPERFSKGMQQKMMLVLAFLKQAKLYLVDEPFMGLDPKAVKKLLLKLEEEKEAGAGILMSTHVLDTAEKICDRFILISGGKLIVQGTLNDIRKLSHLKNGSLLDCFDTLTEDY
ncbi:ABC transporter ATP-binding protein [Sporolactobacillus terrae]|uniref:ABC transporter ATP-binding protein n=1 Tax=Sporolactobacillus terrae TaxID=269673 RepID=UPI000561D8A8|nr:ABC transporter ATP-binding protein [Sporolactobacillus terrae]